VTRHYYEDTGKRTGQFGLFKDTKGCLEEYPKMYGHNVTVVHVFLLISADINLWRVQVQYGCLFGQETYQLLASQTGYRMMAIKRNVVLMCYYFSLKIGEFTLKTGL
jgi:hypothetical protein